MIDRRKILLSSAAVAGLAIARPMAVSSTPAVSRPPRIVLAGNGQILNLEIAERMTALPCFNGKSLPLWTFDAEGNMPVVRVKLGETVDVSVKNALPRAGEHVTIHWHGLRIPNAEDGVAYVTQTPIQPGETGRYSFTPPETGTYFFHTHCNSVEHFGRGLVGALIVEGDEATPSDFEFILMMKDWRLNADRSFLPFSTDDGATRAGTSGTVRAINGMTNPVYSVASKSNVRIRFLNVDPVRISEVGIEGADASIIAVDGNGCVPMPLSTWRMGPASRLDILMRAPATGQRASLIDYFSAEPIELASFVSEGSDRRSDSFKAEPLIKMPFATFDPAKATRHSFTFSATPTGAAIAQAQSNNAELALPIGRLCLSKRSFWAINKQAWSSIDHSDLGPPLASLKLNDHCLFEFNNVTPNAHPIHLHGHTFEVLTSNVRKLPRFRADTILLLPKERIEVALVADNPGRWMLHCHILEHQETGMMGYVSVE